MLLAQVGQVELGGLEARLGGHGVIKERRQPAEPPNGSNGEKHSSMMGQMGSQLHVTVEVRVQGFAQVAAQVTVVLGCPLRPSAGRRRRIVAVR